jgi:hypothetical protein
MLPGYPSGPKPARLYFKGSGFLFLKRGPTNIFDEFINLFDHALARLLPEK